MKGEDFVDALRASVAPETITNIKGEKDGVTFTLSDGRSFKAERKAIAKIEGEDQLSAYIKRVAG